MEEIGENGLTLLPLERFAHDTARDRIDLLGIDTDGAAVIIELKRGKHKLHMLQALSYAAMIADRSADWFTRQLAAEQLDDLRKTSSGELDRIINKKQRIVLIGEDFEPQVIMAAQWLRQFGIGVRCIELRMTTDDAQPKSLYMTFGQIFPSPYENSLFPSAAEVLPKEFEHLLASLRNFTATRSRQVAAPSGSRSSIEGATEMGKDPPKDWESFLGSLKNPDLVEFVKKWEQNKERILPESDYRLIFPRTRERWRIQPRGEHAWVMQGGRFEIDAELDETFWRRLLDERANVRVRRNGKRLYFDLTTKRDFEAFWSAITETLRDVPFSVK